MTFKNTREKFHTCLLLNYIINFISNFTDEMLLKYNGIQRDLYPIIKQNPKPKNITCLLNIS